MSIFKVVFYKEDKEKYPYENWLSLYPGITRCWVNCSLSLTEHLNAFCPQGIMLVGDGYRGKTSPHTPNEKFEGATVLKALKVNPLFPLILSSLGWRDRRRGWGGACAGQSREEEFRRSSCRWTLSWWFCPLFRVLKAIGSTHCVSARHPQPLHCF